MENTFDKIHPSLSGRIEIADILRGFAVAGILLVHFISHFNLHYTPIEFSQGMLVSNYLVKTIVYSLFKDNSYTIFALLFGFSFWIQYENCREKGIDFRLRYLWRLVLLFVIGNINALFFTGDILVLYATVGIILPCVVRLPVKYILLIAVFLMCQPWELGKIVYGYAEGITKIQDNVSNQYFREAFKVLAGNSFWETAKMNLYTGQLASFTWSWEHGRFFQTASLFLFGLLAGRLRLFPNTPRNIDFWMYAGMLSLLLFTFLDWGMNRLAGHIHNPYILSSVKSIGHSWIASLQMTALVAVLILLYYKIRLFRFLHRLAPYGRTSLTNYVSQSVIGSFLFYGWGLELYWKWGTTACFIAGIIVFVLQYLFSVWWLRRHRQGIFEYGWKKLTWIGFPHGKPETHRSL